MKTGYIKIYLPGEPAVAERIDALMEAGLIEISEEHRGSVIILEKWENRKKLRETLRKAFGDIESREEYLEDRDWNKAWTEGFRPLKIADGIWVTAPWHADRIPEEDEKIMIHPGNAFGTGTHESTRLALQQMIRVMRSGFRVLDLGCGSGILSIAARMRGAETVLALDNDPQVRDNFLENVGNNRLDGIRLTIGDVLEMEDYGCDLALINIQKHVILPLLKRFTVAKGVPERVILAGLLEEHEKEVLPALEESGYKPVDTGHMNAWFAVTAVRRGVNEHKN